MALVFAGISPHPPLLVPEVGRDMIEQVKMSQESLRKLAHKIKSKDVERLILITPHGPVFRNALSLLSAKEIQGDLANFGAPNVRIKLPVDQELVKLISTASEEAGLETLVLDEENAQRNYSEVSIDHASFVPLYYLKEIGVNVPVVIISITYWQYEKLYKFGQLLQKICEKSPHKIAIISSGDLSHRLIPTAPAGYDKMGKVFDEKLVGYLKKMDVNSILNMDEDLIERAGECGFRPIIILLGALDGLNVKSEVLSYEGPFGVGYMVAAFEIS